jgi:hypothetical protein
MRDAVAWLTPGFSLAGLWRIRRAIRPHARFEGAAAVEALSADAYLWREHGTLTLADGTVCRARRVYRYEINRRTRTIQVSLGDGTQEGGLLHVFAIPPDGTGAHRLRHKHLCAPDAYCAQLSVASQDLFRLSYVVAGPQKSYSIASVCRRLRKTPAAEIASTWPSALDKR